jgi:hypothetical protein
MDIHSWLNVIVSVARIVFLANEKHRTRRDGGKANNES